ncbi:MAG: S9 family peptidase [Bacteroidales bacterium]|nr:S9 family peptidase [Bacteroidales bacterium]
MRKIGLLITFMALLWLEAQVKKVSFDDIFNRKLYPQTWNMIQPIPSSEKFSSVIEKNLIEINEKGQLREILSLENLNQLMSGQKTSKLYYFPEHTWIDHETIRFIYEQKVYLLKPYSKEIQILYGLDKEADHLEWNPIRNIVAYTKGNNVFIKDEKGNEIQVTFEKKDGIVCGQSVHRNEFGIEKGLFWSPDGQKLAFYRMDESNVTEYPLYQMEDRVGRIKHIRYPMAGMQSHHVKLGIYSLVDRTTVFLNVQGPEDQYLTSVTWVPNSRQILVGVLNRDQNHLKVNLYSAENGELIKTLFEETHDKYVEPLHPAFFTPKGDKFIWLSRRNGFRHLYLYDLNGKLHRQLTEGQFEVLDVLGFVENGFEVLYTATTPTPIDRQVWAVNLQTGKKRLLTPLKGDNVVFPNEKGVYICFNQSSTNPGEYTYVRGKHTVVLKKLTTPLSWLDQTFKIFTIKAQNGESLYAQIIFPPDFDSTKKYPAILYVYGGPHVQLVRNTWLGGANLFLFHLASLGYVVFLVDGHGSANRGMDFESATFRKLSKIEVEDQMSGVRYLLGKSWIDKNRLGVHGWSFGGFMTLSLVLTYPDVFKVAVAGGSVTDWKYYEVMYTERYMDTPEDNPLGYELTSTLNKVDSLRARLLLIHGMQDDIVVPQHLFAFIQKAIEANKIVDLWLYPNQKHNVFGIERKHLYKRIITYFEDFL